MSAKIAAVNQMRAESEFESNDRPIKVSVIDVEPRPVPMPPSYEQAITKQTEIERQRVEQQQRALEEMLQEQSRLQRVRMEERETEQQVHGESSSTSRPPTAPPTPLPPLSTQTSQQFIQHVYSTQPVVGPLPANVTCPSCRSAIKTRVQYVTTAKTHLGALLCCVVCFPCAFCPYVMRDCRDALHYCPSCGAYIGVHTPNV